MKLADTRKYYNVSSTRVSGIVRQLGLAGVALIWIFRRETGEGVRVSRLLISAGILIALGLVCDLAQYALATRRWDQFNLAKEKELSGNDKRERVDFPAPGGINDTPKFFFWAKCALICAGYLFIIIHMVRVINLT